MRDLFIFLPVTDLESGTEEIQQIVACILLVHSPSQFPS